MNFEHDINIHFVEDNVKPGYLVNDIEIKNEIVLMNTSLHCKSIVQGYYIYSNKTKQDYEYILTKYLFSDHDMATLLGYPPCEYPYLDILIKSKLNKLINLNHYRYVVYAFENDELICHLFSFLSIVKINENEYIHQYITSMEKYNKIHDRKFEIKITKKKCYSIQHHLHKIKDNILLKMDEKDDISNKIYSIGYMKMSNEIDNSVCSMCMCEPFKTILIMLLYDYKNETYLKNYKDNDIAYYWREEMLKYQLSIL
jgi:hypothetical protein